jgi:ribonuclease HI
VAAVARDDTGLHLGASVVVFSGKTEAETLEALACREAVSLAKDINARKVRVASDCKNVVANLE